MAGPWEKYAAQGGMVQIAPADPYKARDAARQDASSARDQARFEHEVNKPQILGDSGFMFDPKTKTATPIPGFKPKKEQIGPQQLANLRSMEQQLGRVEDLYQKGPGATKGISGLLDYLPTNSNAQFDTAGAGLGEMGLAAFRVPGVGSQSDAELRAFVQANRPSASDRDPAIEEKLRNLRTRLADTYKAWGIPYKPKHTKKPAADGGWKIEVVR